MLRIGIDAMGGDFAPYNVVLGAAEAYSQISDNVELHLLGDKIKIAEICSRIDFDPSNFVIVHCSQEILMGEHPVRACMKKTDSSIVVGYRMLNNGDIDAFASSGNTGAMLAGLVQTMSPINGILRPCISAEIPLLSGGSTLILDVGFNSDSKPDMLYQFAQMGSVYAKAMMGIDSPKVALLNIGGEQEKGNLVTKEAYSIMSDSRDFNFVGNIEANNLFNGGVADVVVTDGFTGNICLKQAEGMYNLISQLKIKNDFLERFNYELYGGTPVLGVSAPVIIGHGASSPKAFANMIFGAMRSLESELIQKFCDAFCKI